MIEQKFIDSESIEDVSKDSRTVKVVWARIGNVDLANDIIAPSAFTKTIAERGPMGKKLIWALSDHHASFKNVLGKPSELYVDGDKLVAVVKIVDTEHGEDMIKFYDEGLINQHSIGFETIKSEYNSDTQLRTITELKLYEGSAVLWACNPETPTLDVMKSIDEQKQTITDRIEKLTKSLRSGTYKDETFSLLEIQLKYLQAEIAMLNTPPAQAVEPKSDEAILKALQSVNQLFKH